MTIQNIGLFKALTAKMSYLDHRQSVIAQNVANADTPGYTPMDLTPVDFGRVLNKVRSGGGVPHVGLESTRNGHIGGAKNVNEPDDRDQRQVYEVAPAGNAVIMEEQMMKAGKTSMEYSLMTSLYQKNVGMFRTVLG